MGPAELVPAEPVSLMLKLSNLGPAELVPAKLVPVLQFLGPSQNLKNLKFRSAQKSGESIRVHCLYTMHRTREDDNLIQFAIISNQEGDNSKHFVFCLSIDSILRTRKVIIRSRIN